MSLICTDFVEGITAVWIERVPVADYKLNGSIMWINISGQRN